MTNALIALLGTKNFLDINVKELCLVANINRSTFYAYYDNVFELLEDSKDRVMKNFINSFNGHSYDEIRKENQSIELLSEEYLIPYLKFIKENKEIYEVYAKNSLTFGTEDYFKNIVEHIAKPIFQKRGGTDEVALVYICHFYIDGIDSIIRSWISGGLKENEEYISSIIVGIAKRQ